MRKIALGGDDSSHVLGTPCLCLTQPDSPIGIYKTTVVREDTDMTTETLDMLEKQIGKIDAAILKYTEALNANDMARRSATPVETRNELAGDVYKSRQDLERILSTAKDSIQAEREKLNADAPIVIWPFHDSPKELQSLSTNGGDEDWIAVLDSGLVQPFFLEDGGRFGCCAVERHILPDGRTVLIGCHA